MFIHLPQVGVVQGKNPEVWGGDLKGRALKVVHIQNEWRFPTFKMCKCQKVICKSINLIHDIKFKVSYYKAPGRESKTEKAETRCLDRSAVRIILIISVREALLQKKR